MPAYAYPITINRERKTKYEQRHYVINNDILIIEDLTKIVGNNQFCITYDLDNYRYDITVYTSRLETDEEFNNRIERNERYMQEYNKRHGNN